jgi:hypothetical protein
MERRVAVVSADKDTITLAGGVEDGERVVTSPLRGAKAGDKVTPTGDADMPAGLGADDEALAIEKAVRQGALQ